MEQLCQNYELAEP